MFIYYNANPIQERIGDCVIRAISFILDIDYYDVVNLLFANSNYFNCDMLVRDCYAQTLTEQFHLPQYSGMGKTVEEVVEDFYDKKLLLRIDEHLTCAKYGTIYDTWDTSKEIVDCFWVID